MGYESKEKEAAAAEASKNKPPYIVVQTQGSAGFFAAQVCKKIEEGYVPQGGMFIFPAGPDPLVPRKIVLAYSQGMIYDPETAFTRLQEAVDASRAS